MNTEDMIESYVRDVASRLPRRMRNDVACELRALLAEDTASRAEVEGRAPDTAMVMAVLGAFGMPAEAARRYHERPAIIDAADTHHFIIWALAGLVVIGLDAALSPNPGEDRGGQFLQWLGTLVIVLGIIGWWRRRQGDGFRWKPKPDPDRMPRWAATIAGLATLAFPVAMYIAPQPFTRTLFLGVVPVDGLELTQAFAHSGLRMVTAALLLGLAATYVVLFFQGRWQAWLRKSSAWIYALLGIALIAHADTMRAMDGTVFKVFVSETANANAGPIFKTTGGLLVLLALYLAYREWARIDPAPEALRQTA